MSMKEDEQLYLLMTMFSAGKELSEMYRRYTGDLDWQGWLKETLPKTDLLKEWDKFITERDAAIRIDELRTIGQSIEGTTPAELGIAVYINYRISELKAIKRKDGE